MSVDCPECGAEYPDDAQVGDGCDGCGAVYNPESGDDEEELDSEHDVEDDDDA